ncbi:molybdenum cofactor guanylyltransferase MobA [Shimwellia pseudoproteus]|uniref:molybdenum cofactor guanylyltransferase MobA n=1 Tax=Shimwellia pseudoproteus TaxID=570012 RepID=UPI0018ECE345|nr:molybdenum cofactor guanylyltransferase MobA [Shimwellia pseudoproteus]MBJ3816051.1 molybdenum cofactor guanylyltransferase MobA [Shimwellia pseudoproteus]
MRLSQLQGAILAGGRATRMGGQDKGLVQLNGQPLWQRVYTRLAPQTGGVMISANRNIAEYQKSGLPVVQDTLSGFPGPLAGMLAVLASSDREWFLFCPCDVPGIPQDLARRLWENKQAAPAAWVHDGERDHPTIALVHRRLQAPLREYLQAGERRVMVFLRQAGGVPVSFAGQHSAFANVNSPDDLILWQENN